MISFSINEAAYKHFSFIKIRLRFLNVPLLLLKLWVFLDLMALLIIYLKLYLFIYLDFALQVLHNLYFFKKRKEKHAQAVAMGWIWTRELQQECGDTNDAINALSLEQLFCGYPSLYFTAHVSTLQNSTLFLLTCSTFMFPKVECLYRL